MEYVTSEDGTSIAFDFLGEGDPLIVVAGALADRSTMRPLAEALAERFTVINFDRRRRGDTGDESEGHPRTPDREIEDIAALIEAAGGGASVYGHSSGASLAFHAAASGLNVTKLVLHEAPFAPDVTSREWVDPRDYARELESLLAEGKEVEATEAFMRAVGMPEEILAGMKGTAEWDHYTALGASLAGDSAAMSDASGGKLPHELVGRITMPTMVLIGDRTFDFMIEVGRGLAAELPDGHFRLVEGADHEAGPDLIGPPVRAFLA